MTLVVTESIMLTCEVYNVKFMIPLTSGYRELMMECGGNQTVGQIKDNLWRALYDSKFMGKKTSIDLYNKDNYTFTYKKKDTMYELFDERQMFQTLGVIKQWKKEQVGNGILFITKKIENYVQEKQFRLLLSYLISVDLQLFEGAQNDEVQMTRRKLNGVRLKAVNERDVIDYTMERQMTQTAVPISMKTTLHCRVHLGTVTKMFKDIDLADVNGDQLMTVVIAKMLPDLKEEEYSMYVLRSYGRTTYLYGDQPLINYTYIRTCITKNILPLEFALTHRLDPNKDKLEFQDSSFLLDDSVGLSGTHNQLSASNREHHSDIVSISMFEINKPFRIRFLGIDNLHTFPMELATVFVRASLYHGGILLCQDVFTEDARISQHPRWSQWLTFQLRVKDLPKAARLHLVVRGKKDPRSQGDQNDRGVNKEKTMTKQKGLVTLHWVNLQLLDHRSILRTGVQRLPLWPAPTPESLDSERSRDLYHSYGVNEGIDPSPAGSTAVNPVTNKAGFLFVELDTYAHPVAYPSGLEGGDEGQNVPDLVPEVEEKIELDKAISGDPLKELTHREKALVQKYLHYSSQRAEALPKYLLSLDWGNVEEVSLSHQMLKRWAPLSLEVAMQLLDYHVADAEVRKLAVKRLEKMSDEEVQLYLLQMVQVLKFEPYHDSALGRFLLERALKSKTVGHYFYWFLRSEMGTHEYLQRFSILLEAYLNGCGSEMINSFRKQVEFVTDIVACSKRIKEGIEKPEYKKQQAQLITTNTENIKLPAVFCPVYDPALLVGDLNYKKIKVMDSKKKPIWLEFCNKDEYNPISQIKIIMKHGDDLRQDMLTLQMLKIMNNLWLQNGMDLHMIPYGCLSTGFEEGLIEVVQQANTVCNIQKEAGVLLSAFKESVLLDWLEKKNQHQDDLKKAKENFMYSCAGYCVATYILGIGDRHNDNIMVTENGNLFHIDFGHFLGNKKKKLGVDREPVPFILTPDFVYIMGGKSGALYTQFLEIATRAYLILRRHSALFITLFSMMKCTGIPELTSVNDLAYLQRVFLLSGTDEEATTHFHTKVNESRENSLRVLITWQIHTNLHK
ncbi:Phosphatidylinositol 4,5-bisphosphate 3-kinase catalytic subunit gamma isoform-like [Oopsacas minuta]|uniref:phosphatidylinositol 3-kinase n=1 Tax=Oopsacas minuta TaxID=111878 RepID=A0AAV7JX90_9METZ|nr:Phosphatidylinositol 4,5-bisphosphate 3-kinase catalytic subunit gamma isoform-like [Oopsacas minuta]